MFADLEAVLDIIVRKKVVDFFVVDFVEGDKDLTLVRQDLIFELSDEQFEGSGKDSSALTLLGIYIVIYGVEFFLVFSANLLV